MGNFGIKHAPNPSCQYPSQSHCCYYYYLMFYCLTDSLEFEISGPHPHTIMLKHSMYYSATLLTMVAAMLRQPIKRCGLVAYQSHTKTF